MCCSFVHLPVADVDGKNMGGAVSKSNLRKAACRCTEIKNNSSRHRQLESRKTMFEFEGGAGDPF